MTEEVKAFLLKRLSTLRKKGPCTSTALQGDLAREMGIAVDASKVRRVLRAAGYKWLPRMKKKVFAAQERAARAAFAQEVLALTAS